LAKNSCLSTTLFWANFSLIFLYGQSDRLNGVNGHGACRTAAGDLAFI
jgi:uncharacterized membrane protein